MTQINESLNKVRRSDRAKGDTWIEGFLLRGAMGTLATCLDGQPFLVTRNYAYDPERAAIYLHGARKGRTYRNIQANNRICFSVSEMGRLLPADEALEVGVEYAGVVIFGRVYLVEEQAEAIHGLQLLLDKYFPQFKPGEDYRGISNRDLQITAVLRIDIESWSGKEKKVDEVFPKAFLFEDRFKTAPKESQ
jgi:nitroimidazol reductase NimA-like FMN-containing flavoprotein (pyridoxamine 5'-phosphate oxidase superfamily)